MSQGNQRSLNSMKRCKNLETILPTDLIMEIFSRLPIKSIARFRSVSKLYSSMLSSPYFTELFGTRSSAHPRLLFAVEGDDEWLFYSSPQPHNPYEKKSLIVAAHYHAKFHGPMNPYNSFVYASGLIYFPKDSMPMICNPITGQYVTLPQLDHRIESTSFLGFDPIDKQFKVLAESQPFCHKTLTLGTGKLRWENNSQCPRYIKSLIQFEGLCINGVLYYLAKEAGHDEVIVCFDVRSEKFKFIESECIFFFEQLIEYNGKLCGIDLTKGDNDSDDDDTVSTELHMWVLEDVEKYEWSKYVYTLPENKLANFDSLYVVGVIATGEIVLAIDHSSNSKPFYVFYFSPERNTLLNIEIQGFEAYLKDGCIVYTFVDYVEDHSFIDVKHLCSVCEEEEDAQPKYRSQKGQNHNINELSPTSPHFYKMLFKTSYEMIDVVISITNIVAGFSILVF